MENTPGFWQRIWNQSLSVQILIGLTAGVLLGIFFGELIRPIDIIADGYILLLQMTVLPYVTISLISGIGKLTGMQAKILFSKLGVLLLLLWSAGLFLAYLMQFTFPDWQTASFYSTSLIQPHEAFNFLNLYIPANPFNALANNIVPAVVLFSVGVGIALIYIENKGQFLDFLDVFAAALSKVSWFIVRLTPIGLFAIGANLAGTLRFEELERVQVYLLSYSLLTILLTIWILPALVSTLTPVSYREVLKLTSDALITAFMTGNLFVVLPILSEASKKILAHQGPDKKELLQMPDVIVPASFNFPHAGKILSISFILFAAWFADVTLSALDQARLGFLGVMSYFGSLTVAIPYLLDVFRIPIDTFQLFLATGLVNSRFGSAAAAMHTFVLAVLGASAVSGLLTYNRRKIFRFLLLTTIFTGITIGGLHFYFNRWIEHKYTKAELISSMNLTRKSVLTTIKESFKSEPENPAVPTMDRIHNRGTLRVGYLPDSLPYAYWNNNHQLVGFDIEMAHQLASDMGVTLEFVPVERSKLVEQINDDGCDVVMSGVSLTTERAREMLFTVPYLEEHMAFITQDYRRDEFLTRDSIREHSSMRIGILNLPYYIMKIREYAPNVELVPVSSISKPLENSLNGLDGLALTAERGSAWSLLYPQYSVVVPQPDVLAIPLAYAVGQRDEELVRFLNIWLELKKNDGTILQLYDHWILGKNAERKNPRWSVVRNVLHWLN